MERSWKKQAGGRGAGGVESSTGGWGRAGAEQGDPPGAIRGAGAQGIPSPVLFPCGCWFHLPRLSPAPVTFVRWAHGAPAGRLPAPTPLQPVSWQVNAARDSPSPPRGLRGPMSPPPCPHPHTPTHLRAPARAPHRPFLLFPRHPAPSFCFARALPSRHVLLLPLFSVPPLSPGAHGHLPRDLASQCPRTATGCIPRA